MKERLKEVVLAPLMVAALLVMFLRWLAFSFAIMAVWTAWGLLFAWIGFESLSFILGFFGLIATGAFIMWLRDKMPAR